MIYLVIILVAGLLLYAVITGAAKKPAKPRYRQGAKTGGTRLTARQMTDRWSTIDAMAAGGGNGLRQAVSEADKLFDNTLRSQGFAGDTMGDRLKAARSAFSSYSIYDSVWRAHKLRNALAHEVGFDLVASQANEALRDFRRGLQDLGALK